MKKTILGLAIIASVVLVGCGDGASKDEALQNAAATEKAQAEAKASGKTKAMVPQFDLDR